MTRRGPRLFSVRRFAPNQPVLIKAGTHHGKRGKVITYIQKAGHPNAYKVEHADGSKDWYTETALEQVPAAKPTGPVLVVNNDGDAA